MAYLGERWANRYIQTFLQINMSKHARLTPLIDWLHSQTHSRWPGCVLIYTQLRIVKLWTIKDFRLFILQMNCTVGLHVGCIVYYIALDCTIHRYTRGHTTSNHLSPWGKISVVQSLPRGSKVWIMVNHTFDPESSESRIYAKMSHILSVNRNMMKRILYIKDKSNNLSSCFRLICEVAINSDIFWYLWSKPSSWLKRNGENCCNPSK